MATEKSEERNTGIRRQENIEDKSKMLLTLVGWDQTKRGDSGMEMSADTWEENG